MGNKVVEIYFPQAGRGGITIPALEVTGAPPAGVTRFLASRDYNGELFVPLRRDGSPRKRIPKGPWLLMSEGIQR